MQFLKRIQPLFLSFTLVACCLTFEANTILPTTAHTTVAWILNSVELSSNEDIYKIRPRKSENIIGDNFSIFRFKCFLKQRKTLLATLHKHQQSLLRPQHAFYLKFIPKKRSSKDHIFIS